MNGHRFNGRQWGSGNSLVLILMLWMFAAPPAPVEAFTLGVRTDLSTGSGPASCTLADLNHDGALDVVSANFNSHTVSVLLGNGTGGFAAKRDFAVGFNPRSVAIGDLNRDGRPDLVVANWGSSNISVLVGDGSGNFGSRTDIATPLGPYFVALADLNRNGNLDLAVANNVAGSTSVMLGNGAGGFGASTDYVLDTAPRSLALADVSGDGRLDLIVGENEDQTVSVRFGDGAGGFGPATFYLTGFGAGSYAPSSVVVGDVSGDGKPDIVVANANADSVAVLLGDGVGSFDKPFNYATGDNPRWVAIADLNGDGRPDLATANMTGNSVSVLPGTGGGAFGARVDHSTGAGSSPGAVVINDVSGDGKNDLLVTIGGGSSVAVLLAGTTLLTPKTNTPTGDFPHSVVLADLNNDGKLDQVTANFNSSTISVRLGNGAGGFGPRDDYPTGPNPIAVTIGDIDKDGRPDIATANYFGNNVSVLKGTGSGLFAARVDILTGVTPQSVAIVDISSDGNPDLIVSDAGSDSVSVRLGDGSGGFGTRTRFQVGDNPVYVAVKDVSGDGLHDLVTANYNSHDISVLLGNGLGGFGARTTFAAGLNPSWVDVGDVSGDGVVDLAVANSSSHTVSMYRGMGGGAFAAKKDFTAGTGAYSVALKDMNEDGRLDLAVANRLAGTASVLLGSGSSTIEFGPKTDHATGADARSMAIGDLNLDGRPDLVTANSADDDISVLRLRAPTRLEVNVTAPAVVQGVAVQLRAALAIRGLGQGTPSDSVQFFDGNTLIGTVKVTRGGIRVGAGSATSSETRWAVAQDEEVGEAILNVSSSALGRRSFTAVYKGDPELHSSISSAVTQEVVPTAAPAIVSIQDILGDQGGRVRVRFQASPFDHSSAGALISSYLVYRRIPAGSASTAQDGVALAASGGGGGDPFETTLAGWDDVATVTATTDAEYNVVVPTLADSNATGIHRATFMVRALTGTPGVHYDSPPDSGYSVDNLPPPAPTPFTASYSGGASHLHWGASTAPDFWHYRLYRGAAGDFTPGPSNLVVATSDTGYVDVGPAGSYYKLSAVDVNGNESGYALVSTAAVDVSGSSRALFALNGAQPNPGRSERLMIFFSLPSSAPATLELIDLAGRRVIGRPVGALGSGRHRLDLAAGRPIPPGVYHVRLMQGTERRTVRVAVIH